MTEIETKPAALVSPLHLSRNRLYIGDALDGLLRVEPESAQLVLADPPYEVSRPNNLTTMGRTGIDFAWDKNFDQVGWLPLAAAALVPGGSIVIWNDWKKLGIIADALEALDFSVKRKLMWLKANPAVRNIKRSFTQTDESAVWATKKKRGKRTWVFHKHPNRSFENGVFRYPIPRTKKGQKRHPAAKPPKLYGEIMEILTNVGDLVVDPFAGNCPTAAAAKEIGRDFICIERDPQWVATAPCSIAKL